jgi:hypothetical protein
MNVSSGDWRSNWFDVKLTSSSADCGTPSIWGLKKNRKHRLDKNIYRLDKNIYIWLIYLLKKFGWKIGNINVAVNDLILCFNAKLFVTCCKQV